MSPEYVETMKRFVGEETKAAMQRPEVRARLEEGYRCRSENQVWRARKSEALKRKYEEDSEYRARVAAARRHRAEEYWASQGTTFETAHEGGVMAHRQYRRVRERVLLAQRLEVVRQLEDLDE